jgi:hypothetical protein
LKPGLAGDTMLGREVAEAIGERRPDAVVADEVVAVAHEADLLVLNLEWARRRRWRQTASGSPFSAAPVIRRTTLRAPRRPEIAYGLDWVSDAVAKLEAEVVLVTPY